MTTGNDDRDARKVPAKCKAKTKNGAACNADVYRDGYCRWHHPDKAEENRVNAAKGGKARSNEARARKALKGDLRDIADVQSRLMSALRKVEAGEMEPGPANAMANLARSIVTLAGVVDFETQLGQMQRQMIDLSAKIAERSAS